VPLFFYQTGRGLATVCHGYSRLSLGVEPADGFAQPVFYGRLPLRQHHLAAVQFPHVKTVYGRAALGHDARGGGVQRQPGQRLRHGVQQPQPVLGHDFNERAVLGCLVVEMDLRRHPLAGIGLVNRLRDDPARDERGQVRGLVVQHPVQQGVELVARLARGEAAGGGVVDEKVVEYDAVVAREDLRAEDVQSEGAERAGNLAEQPGPVPGADPDDVVTTVGLVLPGRRRGQHAFLVQNLPAHETMRQFEVGGNVPGGVNLEITRRHRGEVRVEFLAGDGFRGQGADLLLARGALYLGEADEFLAAGEQRQGAVVKFPEQRIFEAVPQLVAGALRIGKGQEGKQVQRFGRFDLPGEIPDDGGVVEVAPLGGAGHEQVVFDEGLQHVGRRAVQPQPFGGAPGHFRAGIGVVSLFVDRRFADVMQQQREVEQAGVFGP